MRTAVHGTTEGRIAAVDHFFDIFHLRVPGMKSVFDFFVIVSENFLQSVHETIMQEKEAKRNLPLKD